jgi:hypothetical protein
MSSKMKSVATAALISANEADAATSAARMNISGVINFAISHSVIFYCSKTALLEITNRSTRDQR